MNNIKLLRSYLNNCEFDKICDDEYGYIGVGEANITVKTGGAKVHFDVDYFTDIGFDNLHFYVSKDRVGIERIGDSDYKITID